MQSRRNDRGSQGTKKKEFKVLENKTYSAPNVGLEPTTLRLRVSCSTDWASQAYFPSHILKYVFEKQFCPYSDILLLNKYVYSKILDNL